MNNDAQPAPAKTQPPRPTLLTLLASIGVIFGSIWFCCSGVMCSGPGSSDRDIAYVPVSGNTPEEETLKFRELVAERIDTDGLSFEINNHFKTPAKKVIQVRFEIGDNLTEGMVRRGAMMDIETVLRAIDESGIDCEEVTVFGSMDLVDKLGNVSNETVVKATYSGSTIEKINWANFLTDNVYKIADNVTLHPVMRD